MGVIWGCTDLQSPSLLTRALSKEIGNSIAAHTGENVISLLSKLPSGLVLDSLDLV